MVAHLLVAFLIDFTLLCGRYGAKRAKNQVFSHCSAENHIFSPHKNLKPPKTILFQKRHHRGNTMQVFLSEKIGFPGVIAVAKSKNHEISQISRKKRLDFAQILRPNHKSLYIFWKVLEFRVHEVSLNFALKKEMPQKQPSFEIPKITKFAK